ncbi:MAG TPA: cadherin-like domain-containing protein, partial [Alphaproteobacteria bacterium]|nr:cadherin-like domain-containing protein [Alphaproteobacteria bacterium]
MSQKDTSTMTVSMAQGPSLQPTPTPVVNTASAQAIATAQSVSASLPAYNKAPANPEHYEVVVRAPAAGGMLAYLVGPGAEVVLKDIDLSKAVMANEAGNLRITLANGAEVLLLDFMSSAHSKAGVSIVTNEGTLPANTLLSALDHDSTSKLNDVQPAAGIQTVGTADASHGGFQVPTVEGVHYGVNNPVLSDVIGPFALGIVRDSIITTYYPEGQGPGKSVPPVIPGTSLVANPDTYSTLKNTPITFDSKVNDFNPEGTPFSVTSFTQPGHGTLVLNADNTFTFTPANNFVGTVTFQYTITDGEGDVRTATDTIVVNPTPPLGLNAVNDNYTTNQNTPITFDSKVNDSNPDGTPFTITSFTQPGHGTLVLNANNTFTFTPAHNF